MPNLFWSMLETHLFNSAAYQYASSGLWTAYQALWGKTFNIWKRFCSLRTSAFSALEVSRLCANYVDVDIDIRPIRLGHGLRPIYHDCQIKFIWITELLTVCIRWVSSSSCNNNQEYGSFSSIRVAAGSTYSERIQSFRISKRTLRIVKHITATCVYVPQGRNVQKLLYVLQWISHSRIIEWTSIDTMPPPADIHRQRCVTVGHNVRDLRMH